VIWVTGLPHSGTTAMWSLLTAAGFDGGDDIKWEGDGKGGEWWPLVNLGVEMLMSYQGFVGPQQVGWNRWDAARWLAAVKPVVDRLRALPFPDVVKLPDYGQQLLFAVVRPEKLIIVERDVSAWVRSMMSNVHARRVGRRELAEAWKVGTAMLKQVADWMGVDHVVVEFPRFVDDVEYAAETVAGFVGVDLDVFVEAHRRSMLEGMVTFR